MMQRNFHIRRITKGGTIRLRGKVYRPDTDDVAHLIGRSMVFNTYDPDPGFIGMWGTPEFYFCPDSDSEYGKIIWNELCKLMGRDPHPAFPTKSGHILLDGDLAYDDRGIGWWREMES